VLPVEDVHLELSPHDLLPADHVFDGLDGRAYFLCLLEGLIPFRSELFDLFFLLLHFFLESGTYFFLPLDFVLQIPQLIFHAGDLNIQILCTFGIVIG
jgi:hypothetical protein